MLLVASSVLAVVRRDQPIAPGQGALLGAYTRPRGDDQDRDAARRRWSRLERQLGRSFDIGHSYYRWDLEFPSWRERFHLRRGRIPMISWNGTDTRRIADGLEDELIIARARAVADLGSPVLLRWFWEMDGNRNAELARSPEDFVAAWIRIRSIFREHGARAEFVWCPNASAFDDGTAEQWYPGDDEVDWICADGFNWAPGQPNQDYQPLGEIFRSFHDWAAGRGKPLMIGETGVQERDPSEKAEWFSDALASLQMELPEVRAFVYFDSGSRFPWWVDSSASSLEAFRALANDPYLNQRTTQAGNGG
jgi:hypothetical protein